MNASYFLFFRGILFEILLLQALYHPEAERGRWWLWFFLALYAAYAAALFAWARRRGALNAAGWSFLGDILATSLVLAGTEGVAGDFYLAYFLVILATCLLQDVWHSFVVGGMACLVYGALAWPGLETASVPTHLLRLSLLLATTFFSAVSVDLARKLRASAADEYREQLAWLERLSTAGRIAASVLHELRTPLNTILLNAESARVELARPGGPPPLEPRLRLIESEAERVSQILSDFLDFTGSSKLALEPVALRELVSGAYARISSGMDTGAVDFENRLSAGASVMGSARHLTQVFLNIFDNAIEAMPMGGRLRVEERREGGFLEVSVRDTGVGITPERQTRLFEPFATSRPSDGGHGLGLYVVRWLVRKHGGDIRVRSQGSRRGTEVIVALPMTAEG